MHIIDLGPPEIPIFVEGVKQRAATEISPLCTKCGSIWSFNGNYASCVMCGNDQYLAVNFIYKIPEQSTKKNGLPRKNKPRINIKGYELSDALDNEEEYNDVEGNM